MIEKDYGRYVVHCDACDEILGNYDSWEDARAAINEAGWKTKKIGDEWINLCPDCKNVM